MLQNIGESSNYFSYKAIFGPIFSVVVATVSSIIVTKGIVVLILAVTIAFAARVSTRASTDCLFWCYRVQTIAIVMGSTVVEDVKGAAH